MADIPQETHVQEEEEEDKAKSSSSDDDSSSSSSGSSSSDSSSDSESEDEAEAENGASSTADAATHASPHLAGRSGLPNAANASGPALSAPRPHGLAANKEPLNVNSTRAVARFRAAEERNATQALMPLGTRKRDRRTIEEIQRDLRDKRKKPLSSGTLAARSSPPPRGSPVRSPEADAVVNSGAPMAVGGPPLGTFGATGRLPVKRKPVSAHDRLAMKLNGRKTTSAKAKKTANSSTGGSANVPPVSVMTNKSVTRPMTATSSVTTGNSSSSDHGGDTAGDGVNGSSNKPVLPAVTDGKAVRAVLRSMLRYGDLTDVDLYSSAANFADEYKMPSFVERANLQGSTKTSMDQLLNLAKDVAQRAKQAVEARPPHDNIKIFEVEARASQIIERLYENLKLRVAVQRALRTAGCSSGNAQANAQGAYVLVAKQSDLAVLGVHTRDLPNWTWAEKEHDWSQRKDTALLLGVYVHGFGGWEDILNDDLLHFQGQRALKGERLKKRAENLLKRLPAPDLDAGDPRIVQLANSLSNSGGNSNQSLGAQFSAIIQSGAIPGVTASSAPSLATGGGRMQRAAERLAARQQNGEDVSIGRRNIAQNNGAGLSNGPGTEGRQPKTPPVNSRVQDDPANDEPEDGEVGAASPIQSSPSRHKRRSSSVGEDDRPSSRKKHRNTSNEGSSKKEKRKKEQRRSNRSEQKTEPVEVPSTAAEVAPLPLLSTDECYDKWKPDKKLREIRQVLKKMKIMAEWSRNQKDETVVEKVFKYVSTIGEAIDRIVGQHENTDDTNHDSQNKTLTSREADELCTCLWTYAAGFTPFTAQGFERLYDDICADGDALVAAGS
ncbi:hypothetical protein PHYBOEH_004478 [Phytophthora boehmeriae]|uniref:ATP-dependent helicase CHD1-2/hrp3 HTH domain-containing protein n=1 Tax=Phytophthora boehmeriae TaxID=109152 RepID=A0A8T1WNZ0_9STRA|nr:hypothetical protein PHYBOEH_004478 [Phytophthora boehmeriae]